MNINIKLPCIVFGCLLKKSPNNKNEINYQMLNEKFISKQNHTNIKIQSESFDSENYITEQLETEKVNHVFYKNN